MTHLEIEVKFPVIDPEQMRETLLKNGARLKKSRVFEVNHRYDDTDKRLKNNRMVLRLRQDTAATLTMKSKPSGETSNDFKIHTEFEVIVSDFEKMNLILEMLGFHRQQIYEKWRETFVLAETEIVLDTLPYGHFIEIEGEKEDIRKVSDLLGLDWGTRILLSYLELFEQIKKANGLSFSDITFDNFKGFQTHQISTI